jgi:hypothetical protein
VPEKARRRTFTAQYKLDVVAGYDAAPAGEKGAVLCQEGLYSSHVIERRGAGQVGIERGDGQVADSLLAAGLAVLVIPPARVKNLRSRYGSAGNKDDRFGAYVLADAVRTTSGGCGPWSEGTAYRHQAMEIYRRLGMAPDTHRVQNRLTGLTAR